MIQALKNIFSFDTPGRIVYPGWLFFFRINAAGFALLHFLSIQPDFSDLYSYKGYIYPDIMDASYDHFSFTITSLQEFLQSVHIPVHYETLLTICRFAYPLCLVLLILGVFTRVSAVASLFFQLLFIKSIHLYEYGIDYFTTITLFYCCVFPVGKIYSIDNKIYRRNERVPNQTIFLNLLKAHLSIAYFFSGFDKIIGVTWRNGEAVWKTLHSHNYYSIFNLDFLVNTPFFSILGWLTIVIELAYPLFMNLPKIRKYWLAGIIGMHLFIALFMGLFFFSALMILLNLAAYLIPYIPPKKPGNQFKLQV